MLKLIFEKKPLTDMIDYEIAKGKKNFKIDSIKDSIRARKPYAPFITSTLQQAAYNIMKLLFTNSEATPEQLEKKKNSLMLIH